MGKLNQPELLDKISNRSPNLRAAIPEEPEKKREWLMAQLDELDKKKPSPNQNESGGVKMPSLNNKTKNTAALNRPPAWLKHDRNVLRFYMYFQEPIHESPTESYRVHRCVLYYYLEDDTIQVNEPKVDNSGVPQGVFLRRNPVQKEDGSYYRPRDFVIGSEVTLVSRTFRVADCDKHTRNYLLEVDGVEMGPAEEYPEDQFTPSARGNSKASDKSENSQKRPDTLGKFMQYDRKVLRFYATWNDTTLYGGILRYIIHFFLSDNSVEVREVATRNSGRDPFPLMLRRERLPKGTTRLPSGEATEYITMDDLFCGAKLNVYGRSLVLYDCDEFTKEFYKNELGIEQQAMELSIEEAKRHAELEIPPYNGFGGEEDTLRTCQSLVPKAAKSEYNSKYDNKVMRFDAKIAEPKFAADASRKFVISFNLFDNTAAVFEPPERNSGIMGGKFLENNKYKTVMNGETAPRWLNKHDFYVGARVTFCAGPFSALLQSFTLTGCDKFTEKLLDELKTGKNEMKVKSESLPEISQRVPTIREYTKEVEDRYNNKTERDILEEVMARFASLFFQHKRSLVKQFLAFDPHHTGFIGRDVFIQAIDRTNEDFSAADLQVLLRHFFPTPDAKCDHRKFIDVMFDRNADAVLRMSFST